MKRVLVVNASAIGENNGTGVTLNNIFSQYNREDILQLCLDWKDHERNQNVRTLIPDTSFCRLPYTIYKYKARIIQNDINNSGTTAVDLSNCHKSNAREKFHEMLQGFFDNWPVSIKCFEKEIGDFKPEIIYTCGASIRVMKTAYKISKKHNIPIVLHLMDDWPETMYSSSSLSLPYKMMVKSLLRKINKRGKINMAISEPLSQKYIDNYGVEYIPVMNPVVDFSEVTLYEKDKKTWRFLYAGSLYLNRWKSLLEIAKTVYENTPKGFVCRFDLYVPSIYNTKDMQDEFGKYGAVLHDYVKPEELKRIYSESDVMVFAESFDSNICEFIKFSLSTKIPEYMASGKLILAYLADSIYSYSYLKEKKLALVSSDNDGLVDDIRRIFSDSDAISECVSNAYKEAVKYHSVNAVSKKFSDAIEITAEFMR